MKEGRKGRTSRRRIGRKDGRNKGNNDKEINERIYKK